MASLNKQYELPPIPPTLRLGGFMMKTRGEFHAGPGDVEFYEPDELRETLFPGDPAMEHNNSEVLKALDKNFFMGQLMHYDIDFPASKTKNELSELLVDHMRAGRCNEVPQRILELRNTMIHDFERRFEDWEEEMRAWRRRKARALSLTFSGCVTADQRAKCDAQLFLNYYFTTNGEPDMSKTQVPVLVSGLKDPQSIERLAQRIPGLKTATGSNDSLGAICVGWDHGAVQEMLQRFENEILEREREGFQAKCEKNMAYHQASILSMERPETQLGVVEPPSADFNLKMFVGTYIAECDKIAEIWEGYCRHRSSLSICGFKDGVLIAAYNFGIFKGVMILSPGKQKLEALVSNEDNPLVTYNEAIALYSQYSYGLVGDQQRNVEAEGPEPEVSESLGPRLYYRLRVREGDQYRICEDLPHGHLDFSGGGFAFEGLASSFPSVGSDVSFRGFKYSDKPYML